MICPACGTESVPGQFCSNCGAELPATDDKEATDITKEDEQLVDPFTEQPSIQRDVTEDYSGQTDDFRQPEYDSEQPPTADTKQDPFAEGEIETAATDTTDDLFAEDQPTTPSSKDNEFVDKAKEAAINFSNFFLKYLKEPSSAVHVTKSHLISSIITLVIFSLLLSIDFFVTYRKVAGFFGENSFVDGFLIPLISVIILFAVAIGVTFAGVSITHQSFTFTNLVTKFGALAVPFLSLYLVAFIVSLLGLMKFYLAISMASFIGMLFVIPTIIILQKPSKRFDQIFVLLGITLVNLIAFGTIMASFLESIFLSILSDFIGGFMGGF